MSLLKEKVTNLIFEIEKVKSLENTVVEFITDDDTSDALVEKSDSEPADKNESLAVHSENINMSLQSIIREASVYKCEYCNFVAKTKGKLRNHNHTWYSCEICTNNINLTEQWRIMMWRVDGLKCHIEQVHGDKEAEQDHFDKFKKKFWEK